MSAARKVKTLAPLVRHEHWPALLEAALQARRGLAFVWGENDCCLFAADLVKAMTGRDIAEKYRGYKTQLAAARLLKREGGVEGIMEAAARRYGMQECRGVLFAQRGDMCLIKVVGGESLGICIGAKIAGAGPTGAEFVPLTAARRAWRIG